ncbi:hypothetical protein KFK09_018758 [Dendrobium nobile]|uniref:Reverse transcriptase domain-containing protein n=1 Tax=Dendrobium nobile TaxID=94219 RepID=A0A8T3AWV1_DENNO|nr:hypothetical protein KFK09_018758 [Dendrobium nobile]
MSDPWFSYTHGLFENEQSCHNFNLSTPGRIWVKWDPSHLSFTPTFFSSQLIHGLVNVGSLPPFFLSVVYAANVLEDRKVLWEDLLGLSINIDIPWIIMGDFNCYRFDSKKAGGNSLSSDRSGALNNFIFDVVVQDLGSVGLFFTWYNQRVDFPIHIKLDRMLVNTNFLEVFPKAFYKVHSQPGSDHAPLILSEPNSKKVASRFMFKAFWTKFDDFWLDTQRVFERTPTESPIAFFYGCLRLLKQVICKKNWCSSNYISNCIIELKHLQSLKLFEIQSDPLNLDLNKAFKSTSDQLSSYQAAWYSWISQRAKAHWLSQGEDDLGFLYAKIRSRKNRNFIKVLSTANGLLASHDDMAKALINHFRNLFNAPSPSGENSFSIPVGNTVPSNMIDGLMMEVTNDEIKKVVFSGSSKSAPGPDGFSFSFYQQTWHIIGFSLCKAVKQFFTYGKMPRGAKATAITLIPKGSHSNCISDYRPISLCNVFYKIIAKIIANRLKPILPIIIHESQSGFITKRCSTDNIILAAEILREFNKGISNFCAKLDIKKAFDSASHSFLLSRLRQKGFPEKFVMWIQGCITDVHFSINLNGVLEGFFNSTSGLRQGCPLSPLLFCVIMDALSHSLDSDADKPFLGLNHKNFICSHLLFADDLLVFGVASMDNAKNLNDLLLRFADSSGLHINPQKSSILFPKAFPLAQEISNCLGITNEENSIIYLGLPISPSRLKFSHFQPLLSRLSTLLAGWKVKFLSFAGRVQYLKFTIANTIAYWIRGAIIPKTCCKVINKLCSRFLFFGNTLERRMHMIAWNFVAQPKVKGGLGLPSFDSIYHNMACSFIFRMYNDHTLIGTWYRAKYDSVWKLPPSSASAFWKLFCRTAHRISPAISFSVHSSSNISLLWDPWCDNNPIADSFYSPALAHSWDEEPLLFWEGSAFPSNRNFLSLLHENLEDVVWSKFIWHKGYALRFACYIWMAIIGKLKTADNLIMRGINVNAGCGFCSNHLESHSHIFFECDFSFSILTGLFPYMDTFYLRPNILQTFDFLTNLRSHGRHERNFCYLTLAALVYYLWRERNNRRFSTIWRSPNELKSEIIHAIRAKGRNWKSFEKIKPIFSGILG